MRWQRVVLGASVVLIVASVIAAWVAIGQLADSTDRALARTEESLALARVLAVDTAEGVDQIRAALSPVGDGLASTSDALVATRDVSASVRQALSSIRFIDNVQEIREKLEGAEAAIVDVEADLGTTRDTIVVTQLTLNSIVTSVEEVPAQLDLAADEVRENRSRIGRQVLLWRLAAVAGGLALLGVLMVLGSAQGMHGPQGVQRIGDGGDDVVER
jgi:hypothetical protein